MIDPDALFAFAPEWAKLAALIIIGGTAWFSVLLYYSRPRA